MPADGPRELLPAAAIQRRVEELAREIDSGSPPGEPLHLVAVLKGGFMFLADLCRALRGPLTLDFLRISSYGAETISSGRPQLLRDLEMPIADRHILIVEDIVDTGVTLAWLQEMLVARLPQTLRTVALLDKRSRRKAPVRIEYVGFEIPDVFVVGYGLDCGERHRELPYVGCVEL